MDFPVVLDILLVLISAGVHSILVHGFVRTQGVRDGQNISGDCSMSEGGHLANGGQG